MRRPRRSDGGVTLIELVIVTTLLGAVMSVVVGGIMLALKLTDDDTPDSLRGSAQKYILSDALLADLQSAYEVGLPDELEPDEPVCDGPSDSGLVLWTRSAPGVEEVAVAYYDVPGSGADVPRTLVRIDCTDGGAPRTLADLANTGDIEVRCLAAATPQPTPAPTPAPACAASRRIQVTVPVIGGAATSGSGTFDLVVARRLR